MKAEDYHTNQWCQNIQTDFMEFLNKEYVKGSKTLEIASGDRPISGVVIATDYSTSLTNPKVVKGINVLNLPYKDKEFDLVLCRNFISCFDCIGKPELKALAIREMKRVGKAVYIREFNPKLCLNFYLHKIGIQ